jgi:signal transduction histidine kinase
MKTKWFLIADSYTKTTQLINNMVNKTTIILLMMLLPCSIVTAKPVSPLNITTRHTGIFKSVTCAIFKDKAGALWFSSGNILNASHATPYYTDYTADDNPAGKDAGRTLMALNLALGLQSISNENLRLPKIKILLLQPLSKILTYVLMAFFLLIVAIVLITNNITQKKLRSRLAGYEQQRELDMERHRASAEMYNRIATGLDRITNISQTINKPDTRKELVEITQTSAKLINQINELTWCMQPGNNTLDEFFPHLRESLYSLLKPTDIVFSILLPDCDDHIILSLDQRRNMLLTIKEIVHNAIKYSQATEIIVKSVMMDKGLQFFISDNGIGFDTDKTYDGTGIATMQQQISTIAGRLTITSEANTGTYFTLFIPLKA